MKNILYSPKKPPSDDEKFFTHMTAAGDVGGDILIFPENIHTPYDELLCGADILDPSDVDYVLGSLYDFSTVTGCAAVFSSVDASGFPYAVFVNAFAADGDSYSKIYIKHDKTDNLCAHDLIDYEQCRAEIFEPVVYRGFRIGLMLGGDVFIPKLFEEYKKSGAEYIIHPTANLTELKNPPMPVVSCGSGGKTDAYFINGQIKARRINDELYEIDVTKKDVKR